MKTITLKANQKTKKTPAGEIPVDWSVVKLGDYVQEITERNESVSGNILVLSVTNSQGFVSSEQYFDRQVFSKDLSNYKVVTKGQFAYNPARVNVGSIARLINYDKGLLSPMYVIFETKPGLNADFLEHWITSPYFNNAVKNNTQGTVRNSLNYSALADFLFRYPPIIEQKKIAEILSSVDTVIEKTQLVIDQTQTVKKALMQELFTRGIPGKHKKFKSSPLGEVPLDWKIIKLEQLTNLITKGESPNWQGFQYTESGCLFVTSENVRDGFIDLSFPKFVPLQFHEGKLERSQLKSGDVLVNLVGASIGRCCLFSNWQGPANINQAVALIRCNEKIVPEYLVELINSEYIQDIFKNSKVDTARPNISLADLRNLVIKLPNIEEQRDILLLSKNVNAELLVENNLLLSLKILKSALMQVLLTGKLRVLNGG